MTKLLEIRDVTLESNGRKRIDSINISINHGDKIALLGKSGAGKTTLLKIINGSIKPTVGEVIFNGKNITNASNNQRRQIGSLWQDLRLIDELTVGQNVNCGALGRRGIGWAIANLFGIIEYQECLSCLDTVELSSDFINVNIQELSSGQKKRVAIARLIRQESKLIVADEPLSNLDPSLCTSILNMLLKKQSIKGINIPDSCIISLHRPDLINKFNRVIGIKAGQIIIDTENPSISSSIIKNLYS